MERHAERQTDEHRASAHIALACSVARKTIGQRLRIFLNGHDPVLGHARFEVTYHPIHSRPAICTPMSRKAYRRLSILKLEGPKIFLKVILP